MTADVACASRATMSPGGRHIAKHIIAMWGLYMLAVLLPLHLRARQMGVPLGPGLLPTAMLFPVVVALSMWIHEVGHAVAARVLRYDVFRVRLGSAYALRRVKAWGIVWELGAVPFGGVTYAAPRGYGLPRLRHWLVTAAGPGINLALAALLLAGGALAGFHDATARAGSDVSMAALCFYANAIVGVAGLIPLNVMPPIGYSDGWRLLTLPLLSDRKLREFQASLLGNAAHHAASEGRLSEAFAICDRTEERLGASSIVDTNRAAFLLRREEFEAARASWARVLEREDIAAGRRAMLKNNIAWADLYVDPPLLEEAERYSSEVIKKWRSVPWAMGTRGAVLVLLGRSQEGLMLLHKAYVTNFDDHNRAHNAAWIAIAEADLGDRVAARYYLAMAEVLDPDSYSLDRARRAVR